MKEGGRKGGWTEGGREGGRREKEGGRERMREKEGEGDVFFGLNFSGKAKSGGRWIGKKTTSQTQITKESNLSPRKKSANNFRPVSMMESTDVSVCA